jgi:hypothetical protein
MALSTISYHTVPNPCLTLTGKLRNLRRESYKRKSCSHQHLPILNTIPHTHLPLQQNHQLHHKPYSLPNYHKHHNPQPHSKSKPYHLKTKSQGNVEDAKNLGPLNTNSHASLEGLLMPWLLMLKIGWLWNK